MNRTQSRHGNSLKGVGVLGSSRMTTALQAARKVRATDWYLPRERQIPRAACPKNASPTGPIDAAVAKHKAATAGSIWLAVAFSVHIHKRLLGRKQVNTSNVNNSFGTCGSVMDIAQKRSL
jgi:hypothetical protein